MVLMSKFLKPKQLRLGKTITYQMLVDIKACDNGLRKFKDYYPNGFKITLKNLLEMKVLAGQLEDVLPYELYYQFNRMLFKMEYGLNGYDDPAMYDGSFINEKTAFYYIAYFLKQDARLDKNE